jgi:hypothetical protein
MISGLSNCNNNYWTCHRSSVTLNKQSLSLSPAHSVLVRQSRVAYLIFNPGIKIKAPTLGYLCAPQFSYCPVIDSS